ncbi:hypothetical protein L204_102280 [Cryptococcus depauperatus]
MSEHSSPPAQSRNSTLPEAVQPLSHWVSKLLDEELKRNGIYQVQGRDHIENALGLTLEDTKENSKFQKAIEESAHSWIAASKDGPEALTEREYDERQFGQESADEYLMEEALRAPYVAGEMTRQMLMKQIVTEQELADEELAERLLAQGELVQGELTSDAASGTQGADSVGDVDPGLAEKFYRTALRSTVEWITNNYNKPGSARTSVTSILDSHR